MNNNIHRKWRLLALVAATILAAACHKVDADDEKKATPAAKSEDAKVNEKEVELTAEQAAKIGVEVASAKSISRVPEVIGYGVVINHDVIAQAVAEVATAEAAVNQSRAALARAQKLAGTPGAFGGDAEETAKKQSLVDAAALSLAQRKLSATLGGSDVWKESGNEGMLDELASGHAKLVRVTFPLGTVGDATPRTLRFARLDQDARSWHSAKVWEAPADANVPGRSFFAVVKEKGASEGERLQVWAPSGAAVDGVMIPEAAIILHDGQYWCYVQEEPGKFERKQVDISRPVDGGYFVTEGVKADDAVVAKSAGFLLARETNSSTEAD